MKRWLNIIWIIAIISILSFGCAGTSKGLKIKCPKCGAFFTTKEGVEEFEMMRGR
jgi:hypothetical protein